MDVQEASDRFEIRNLIDEYASSIDDRSVERWKPIGTCCADC